MTRSRWDQTHVRSNVLTHRLLIHDATDPDQLAAEEPDPVEVMRWARWVQAEAAQLVECAVQQARADGVPWSVIGEVHGSSRQAAQQRWGHLGDLPA